MNNVNGFTFYRSYFECIDKLPNEDQATLLLAIVYYVYKDIEPEFDGILSALWTVIKPNLDTSKNRSQNPQNKQKTKQKQTKNKTKTKSKQNKNKDLKDKDKDKDKELDKDKDKEIEGDKDYIFNTIEQSYGRTLSSFEYEMVEEWMKQYSVDLIIYAIKKSVLANKKTIRYTNGILKNWKSSGYQTIADIDDNESMFNTNDEQMEELFNYDWLNENNE